MTENYWPEGIATPPHIAPVAILKEQAALLGSRTRNMIVGRVTSHADRTHIAHELLLEVPSLGNYVYSLLAVAHALDSVYPATISAYVKDESLSDLKVASEQDFREGLKKVLSSTATYNLIGNLLAQAG